MWPPVVSLHAPVLTHSPSPGDQGKLDRTFEKIRESVHSVCMICFEKVSVCCYSPVGDSTDRLRLPANPVTCMQQIKIQDAVWQCEQDAGEGCYRSFHLICLQKWARSEAQRGATSSESSSSDTPSTPSWPWYYFLWADGPFSCTCDFTLFVTLLFFSPNCRRPYTIPETPNKYLCFWYLSSCAAPPCVPSAPADSPAFQCYSKKVPSPPNDPWLAPHSVRPRNRFFWE